MECPSELGHATTKVLVLLDRRTGESTSFADQHREKNLLFRLETSGQPCLEVRPEQSGLVVFAALERGQDSREDAFDQRVVSEQIGSNVVWFAHLGTDENSNW